MDPSIASLRHIPLAALPAFRDEADYRAYAGGDVLVVSARGRPGLQWSGWTPAALWFPVRGRLKLATADYGDDVTQGHLFVTEHGARVTLSVPERHDESCAVLLPPEALVDAGDCTPTELPHAFPERVEQAPVLLGPLLKLARRAGSGARFEAGDRVAVIDAVHELKRREQRHVPLVARCPGRCERHRRKHYLRLLRARLALETSRGVDCPLGRLARVANLSPTHFLRVYRRAFGHTPHEHMVHVRLAEAHRRLVATDQPIAEIGRALGFNRCAFTRAFRAYHGASPRELRALSGRRAGSRVARIDPGIPAAVQTRENQKDDCTTAP